MKSIPKSAGSHLMVFSLPSAPGNERLAMDRVAKAVQGVGLSKPRLERLKTAVAEATLNAMEHGNKFQPELEVSIEVFATDDLVKVRITDQGGGQHAPEPETPDLEAKLGGEQTARGWGLFLMKNMVDEVHFGDDRDRLTVELILYLRGEDRERH